MESSQLISAWSCSILLYVLEILHIYWFCLLLRILVKLLNKQKAHDVGRAEYEGNSASDNDSDNSKQD
jgi:hypothetical protein